MVEMLEIICKNNNSKILVPFGSTIHEVSKFAGVKTEFPILGAYVNNKVQNISYKVFMPKTVEFIDINNPNGRRMYALSLMFVLYKAVKDIFPKSDLHIHHSMARGYYSEIKNIGAIDEQRVKLIKDKMTELIEKDIPFLTKTIQTQEAVDIFRKVGLESKARLLETSQRLFADIDTLDGTINHFYSPLVPSTSYLKVFDLVQYDKGLLLVMPSKKDPNKTINGRNKQSKMFTVFQEYEEWIRILGTSYVSDLNEIVKANEYNKLIQVSEALHEKRYSQIADQIFKKRDEIKIVFLAGPSSSGKTTSCRRLATQLSVLGFRPVQISLDDYFLDREFTPKKADGEYDFESIDALDIGLFNKQMNDLLEGKEVLVPRFDFIEGKKIYNGKKIKAQDNGIFIIEGIHALNPKLSEDIDRKNKYNIFVSALTQISIDKHNLISSSDNRLLRRLVRDFNYRGYSAIDTLSRWQSVRSGEEENIFPYQENADSIFNSSLLYEIGVLKTYAKPLLSEVPQNDVAYAEAKRLLRFLANFQTIDDKSIPPTSIMREFLGGSSFEY
ncbi:MAG: nucleoside kinase [Bacteroidales bacterium]|nr:nucleoside kinase [Bacteroidales bacterium]